MVSWGERPAALHPLLQLLAVFKAAFATQNPRLVEPALSCLHKLVGGGPGEWGLEIRTCMCERGVDLRSWDRFLQGSSEAAGVRQ